MKIFVMKRGAFQMQITVPPPGRSDKPGCNFRFTAFTVLSRRSNVDLSQEQVSIFMYFNEFRLNS